MSAEIKKFLADNDKFVADVAKEISVINEDYATGKISSGMHKELIKDAIELARVKSASQTLETKIKLEKLIDFAKLVAKLI
jgi:hypothetical protein